MDLVEAVAVTYELVGQEMSDAAMRAVVQELATYPEAQVAVALNRCRVEVRGRLALSDILDRMPSGHPGVEEAWSIVAKCLTDERRSVVWTEEMREAFGPAIALADDKVAARLAFKEKYAQLLLEARQKRTLPAWTLSLGYDPAGRADAVREARGKGRLTAEQAAKLLPPQEMTEAERELLAHVDVKRLA
jgi:hypothetical protein